MNVYTEYLLLVFLCLLGVLQLVASINKLSAMSFFKRPTSGYLFAIITIFGALSWFFLSKDRVVQGVEGIEAMLLFIGAALLAFLATASISSLINRRIEPPSGEQRFQEEKGLDVLRTTTYFQAIARHFRHRKQE